MKRNLCRILIAALLPLAAAENLPFEIKKEFRNPRIACLSPPAVVLSEEAFYKSAPALRLDGAKLPAARKFAGFVLNIPADRLAAFRGKNLCFEMMVKRLSGKAALGATVRFWHREKGKRGNLLAYKSMQFAPKSAEWEKFTFPAAVPEREDLNAIDVQIGFYPVAGDNTCYLLDEACFRLNPEGGTARAAAPSLGCDNDAAPLKIVENGQAKAKIVIPAEAGALEKYAAQELRGHIEAVTGARLAVIPDTEPWEGAALHVGSTVSAKQYCVDGARLAPNAVLNARAGNRILLVGGDAPHVRESELFSRSQKAMGTLYAVYEFLERELGIRWYWPGRLGSVLPKRATFAVGPLNWYHAPSYETRTVFYAVPNDPDISERELYAWHRRIRLGGHGGSPIGMHSFNHWPEKFGRSNPEYFALQPGGERLTQTISQGGHVCMSNPDVLREVVREKSELFRKNPDLRFSPVMPGDSNGLFYCRCEACRKKLSSGKGPSGVASDAVWDFVNRAAAEIGKSAPGRFVTCCAYGDYLRRPGFALNPNVAVTLCMPKWPHCDPEYKKQYQALILEWQGTGAALYAWDYWLSRYQRGVYGAPAVYPRILRELYLLDHGRIRGRAIELPNIDGSGVSTHNWTDWVYDALNLYVAARLMWDIHSDVDRILEEFYPAFYGPAAAAMKEFHESLEAAWRRQNPLEPWDWEACYRRVYPPAFVDRMMGLLRQAVRECAGREPYASRAEKTLRGYLPFETNSRKFRGSAEKQGNPLTLHVPFSTEVPELDGVLDDPVWRKAVTVGRFFDSYNAYPLESSTNVRLLHTGGDLYLAVEGTFPRERLPTVRWADHAGARDAMLWNFESMEFFFASADGELYQFIAAPDDKCADYHWPRGKTISVHEASRWNSGIRAVARKHRSGFRMEIRIPIADLPFAKTPEGSSLRFNFARNHYYRPKLSGSLFHEQSCCYPTYGSFHNTERYGTLTLRTAS